jgi:hypothetical protein
VAGGRTRPSPSGFDLDQFGLEVEAMGDGKRLDRSGADPWRKPRSAQDHFEFKAAHRGCKP